MKKNSRIEISLNKNSSLFYLDLSSLILSKHNNVAQWEKYIRYDSYKDYKLYMICGYNRIPIYFSISTANVHNSKCNTLLQTFSSLCVTSMYFADKGYGNNNLIVMLIL